MKTILNKTNNDEIKYIFHTLWTKAVGTKEYDKKEWQKIATLLIKQGIEVQSTTQ